MSIDPQSSVNPSPSGHVTLRSIIIGCVLCGLIAVVAPYWTIYLQTSRMFADHHTGGAAFLLFVLLLVFNVILGRFWKPLALRAHELMTITAMMFVSGSIVTSGLIAHFVPTLTGAYFHATPANQWHTILWPDLHPWFYPLDPNGGKVAIGQFWEGLPPGEPIPWGPWIRPLAVWGVFLMALFACMTAVMAIMRKQWVDHEHLSFPIAQVPAELCAAAEEPWHPASILRSRAFWIALAITFLLASSGGIRHYFGVLKPFRIRRVLPGFGPPALRVNLSLVVIGLVFLVPNRLAFSLWSLTLLSWGLKAFLKGNNLGLKVPMLYAGGFPALQHVSMGAMIVFVVGSMWLARAHLRRVLRCALGLGDAEYDAGEPASYRTCVLMVLVTSAFMIVWFRFAGLRVGYGVVLLLAILVIHYGMARVIAQCGLPSASAPILASTYVTSLFGSSALGPGQMGVLAGQIWHGDMRNSAMAGAGNALCLTRRRRGGVLWALILALLITYVIGCACAVWVSYRYGGLNMDSWFYLNSPRNPWMWAVGALKQRTGPSYLGMLFTGAGGGAMALLMLAQRSFFWWPIHPVAFLICHSHMVQNFWFSIFLAWLAKVAVVNLGGYAAYRGARRFAIGMVMGYFLAGGFWGIVDTCTQEGGQAVFYI